MEVACTGVGATSSTGAADAAGPSGGTRVVTGNGSGPEAAGSGATALPGPAGDREASSKTCQERFCKIHSVRTEPVARQPAARVDPMVVLRCE